MAVTHCLCEGKSFRAILEWAEKHRTTSCAEVEAGTGCGKQCGMCEPFIEYALATGVTAIPFPCPPIPAKRLPALADNA